MISYTIYVIDDAPTARKRITLALENDYRVKGFETAEAAIETIKTEPPDLVLLDIGLPGMSGIEALKEIKAINSETLVIMITASEEIGTVISAMKLGAYDYILKPLHLGALLVTLRNALDTIRMRKEIQLLQEKLIEENLPCLIGESNAIQNVIELVSKVAQSRNTSILITGETGTGKELLAGAIHYKSPCFRGRFVVFNCASLPKDLVESELFGYEKGAFTGAKPSGKKGLVEQAANGTLFLDELCELSQEAQAKLLRFLESGEYYRVGGVTKRKLETRVVSATNRDINDLMDKGVFRRDLYYRLAVVRIDLPSLNDRREDILPLARYFLVEFNRKLGKGFTGISTEAEKALESFTWKGNVRELRNLIQRSVLFNDGPELTLEHLGLGKKTQQEPDLLNAFPCSIPPAGIDLPATLGTIEKYYIEEAFKISQGNESQAARLLNINYYTLRHRRKKLFQER
ncbi:MAG: sigma-54-dependent Fis family transcriptional regulator [Deltaproteobacteria bacterium]|nr:sigma-54-dependent Fis family transcriptional regulator [Deltaproteobacteria bacterium]